MDATDTESSLPSPTTSMSSLSSTRTVKRDDFFYFSSVVFEVEETLFKVPRYGLPGDGAAFDAMFARGAGAPGASDDDPIRLDADVSAADFRSLLKATYPPPGTSTADLTIEEWMSVLKLAKKWDLVSIRDKAVSQSDAQIQQKTPAEKILLAKRYTVAKWLREGYTTLVSRKEVITDDETEKLGWETFGKLMKIRESRWAQAFNSCPNCNDASPRCYNCGNYFNNGSSTNNQNFDFNSAIRDAFGDDVKD